MQYQVRINITPAKRRAWISFKRVGGLYHWRVGRLGGSFYLTKP